MDVWFPKSQVRLVQEGGMQHALIPVWLAKRYFHITAESRIVRPQTASCQQCGASITTYTGAPPPQCAACRNPNH